MQDTVAIRRATRRVGTLGLALLAVLALGAAAHAQAPTIFNNGNVYAVENQPAQMTVFTVSAPTKIVKITTYHWNYARGAWPGQIALRSQTGAVYGPWQATGLPGQGGVPNAYWVAYVDIVLPPGTYAVIDSDPATWSQNAGSFGAGIAIVEGYGQ